MIVLAALVVLFAAGMFGLICWSDSSQRKFDARVQVRLAELREAEYWALFGKRRQ